MELLKELWDTVSLQTSIVSLVEALANALDAEFRPFLPVILPRLLQVFEGEPTDSRIPTRIKVFQAFTTFGSNMEEYVHLIIPVIIKSFERPDGSILLRKTAIVTIEKFSQKLNISSHASRIIHPLLRVLYQHSELRMVVMDTLCALGSQLGLDFICFIPSVNKVCTIDWVNDSYSMCRWQCILRYQISHEQYEKLVSTLLNGEHVQPPRQNHGTYVQVRQMLVT
jgi:serine/threonine-protein kinase mTOR